MPPEAPAPFPIDDRFLRTTGEGVARVTLGATLYLADPAHWAGEPMLAAFDAFIAAVPANQLAVYTTSLLTEWRGITARAQPEIREALSGGRWLDQKVRHQFWFKIADEAGAPGLGLSYTEIDPARSSRAAVLELTLPPTSPPETLLNLLKHVVTLGPIYSGVGGYALRWNVRRRRLAFTQFYFWARRYLGLDAQDPDATSLLATQGLPGTNWLTLIGVPFTKARPDDLPLDLEALATHGWRHPVATAAFKGGLLIRAGAAPTLGDRNSLTYPAALAEVAQLLAPHFIDPPPDFWGPFYDEGATGPWLRRLAAPKDWE